MKAVKIIALAAALVAGGAAQANTVDLQSVLGSINGTAADVNDAIRGPYNDYTGLTGSYYQVQRMSFTFSHDAVADSFNSAKLDVTAFDVDTSVADIYNSSNPALAEWQRWAHYHTENDVVSVGNGTNWLVLGSLSGSNNTTSVSSFNITSSDLASNAWLSSAIHSGLQVKLDVDVVGPSTTIYGGKDLAFVQTNDFPAVVPLSSTLTVTTAVPEPESYAMLMAGLGMLGYLGRRRKAK